MKLSNYALALLLSGAVLLPQTVRADDFKPDDLVTLDLTAEDWVKTATAKVIVNVDAAVAGTSASTMRSEMQKAVEAIAKTDWRLTGFSRNQDPTGLERWNASFEARLPESGLGGLHDLAKKASKPGMQMTIADIAFDPTTAEREAVKAKLRGEIYKQANEQLAILNGAIANRSYRIANISFNGSGWSPRQVMQPMLKAQAMAYTDAVAGGAPEVASMERSEKITLQAQIVFAALAPVAAGK
jgi:hypothetical protein